MCICVHSCTGIETICLCINSRYLYMCIRACEYFVTTLASMQENLNIDFFLAIFILAEQLCGLD